MSRLASLSSTNNIFVDGAEFGAAEISVTNAPKKDRSLVCLQTYTALPKSELSFIVKIALRRSWLFKDDSHQAAAK
jgi:hypothetical protein